MEYLGVIELRAQEIISDYLRKKGYSNNVSTLVGPSEVSGALAEHFDNLKPPEVKGIAMAGISSESTAFLSRFFKDGEPVDVSRLTRIAHAKAVSLLVQLIFRARAILTLSHIE